MGKLPYIQFYPADWLQDTMPLSLAAKGAWINILCAQWRSQSRGALTLPLTGWARQIGASVEQTKAAIFELVDMHICDCPSHENVSLVTDHNEKITLVNRRMVREEKSRESNACRQQRFRNKKVTQPDNASVTPYISEDRRQKSKDKDKILSSTAPAIEAQANEDFYLTKKGKRLTGKRLEAFNRLWDAFAYKQGKAEAAEVWMGIPSLTDALVERIIDAAKRCAESRPALKAAGRTPKMLQGWIAGRRWEDEASSAFDGPPPSGRPPAFPLTPRQQQTERFKGMAIALKNREANGNGGNHAGGCGSDVDAVLPVLPGPGCERGNHGDSR